MKTIKNVYKDLLDVENIKKFIFLASKGKTKRGEVKKVLHNQAFTILELVIVVAIISVMTTMLFTTLSTFKNKYADVDVTQLDELEEQYNFTYYDDLILPEPVDYKSILESYGIDVSNLTDEQIKKLIEVLQK